MGLSDMGGQIRWNRTEGAVSAISGGQPLSLSEHMHLHVTGPAGADTILFLHAVGTSGWMWEPIVERLDQFRCLVPDLPGHGQSATSPWLSLDATVDGLAEAIAREATGGRVHVVGLSLGAYVALRLISRHPARAKRTVLSGLNVLPFPHPRLMRLAGIMMAPWLKLDPFLRAQAKALRIPDERFEGYRRSAKAMSRRAFLRIGDELMDFRVGADLRHVTSPTLVLAGEQEQGLIRQSVPQIVRALPGAQGYLVPGVGHGWSGEAPDLFARTVEAWLAGHGLPDELLPVAQTAS